ncbi:hypothetical protein PMAYCL1PPCAC_30723, partial [Pristionchus mayeri]
KESTKICVRENTETSGTSFSWKPGWTLLAWWAGLTLNVEQYNAVDARSTRFTRHSIYGCDPIRTRMTARPLRASRNGTIAVSSAFYRSTVRSGEVRGQFCLAPRLSVLAIGHGSVRPTPLSLLSSIWRRPLVVVGGDVELSSMTSMRGRDVERRRRLRREIDESIDFPFVLCYVGFDIVDDEDASGEG